MSILDTKKLAPNKNGSYQNNSGRKDTEKRTPILATMRDQCFGLLFARSKEKQQHKKLKPHQVCKS
ncbi:hypothetical protein [Motiliproteus coralliicola]|uniref:hypothetical protein n=1 Tax=Motiliproteus coralliicola TaxID=2283196 RepID=UPI001058CD5E|nr:hypothetical protein [Motiliproteus coralliicola]